jgi:formylmethanofuran dehydrogenase subunit E
MYRERSTHAGSGVKPSNETNHPGDAVDKGFSLKGIPDAIWCRDHRGHSYSYREALERIRSFHGHVAPGLVIGLKMVDFALRHLPEGVSFDAVCETTSCLPDAVQMLTPCTVGNSWLKIHDLGKFALTLYDKSNGRGCRVFLDSGKLEAWPEFHAWFYKRKSKAEQDFDVLLEDIRRAGSDCLSSRPVDILPAYRAARRKGRIATCSLCGEAFPQAHGDVCRGCQGQAPYVRPREEGVDDVGGKPPIRLTCHGSCVQGTSDR